MNAQTKIGKTTKVLIFDFLELIFLLFPVMEPMSEKSITYHHQVGGTLSQILQVVVQVFFFFLKIDKNKNGKKKFFQAQVVRHPQLLQTELIIRRKKFNLPKKF